MNWEETLLIRDCIQYAVDEPMYDYDKEEIEKLNYYLKEYETKVNRFIGFAGAMDILIKSGQKKGDQIIKALENPDE